MKPFNIGDYVQVANEGTGKVTHITCFGHFVVETLHDKKDEIRKSSNLQPIELKKLQRDLTFFAELTIRGLPIPQTEIYLYNPFFNPSPFFDRKKGRKVTPRNVPKRHDYFWGLQCKGIGEKAAFWGVSLEVDGGTFGQKSGHNTGVGINNGMEKANWCAYYGIHDLHVRPEQLMNELTFQFLEKLLL